MAVEDCLRLVHVLGATVLFGTGIGIAFFMVMAHRTRDPRTIAHVAGTVVIADAMFTATAVILQPVTGAWLASLIGWPLSEVSRIAMSSGISPPTKYSGLRRPRTRFASVIVGSAPPLP